MTPESAVVTSLLLLVAGSAVVAVLRRARLTGAWICVLVTTAMAALIAIAVGQVLLQGPTTEPLSVLAVPRVGALRFHVDGLSCVFLVLTAVVAVPATVHSVAWVRERPEVPAGRYHASLLLFVCGMLGLVSTTDTLGYLCVFWQFLAIPGWTLIRCGEFESETRSAANTYFLWMEIACAAVMVGAVVLAEASALAPPGLGYDFATFTTFAAQAPGLFAARASAVALSLGLFLVGFGIKMGMWPFGQLWLPQAHAAAPSPVSALLSGVMIKSGVYGVLRCFLWLVPAGGPGHRTAMAGWGLVVAILGTVTLLTGTAQALRQHQTKRLLAFHSIGQVGYILLGAGACMLGLASDDPALAPVAAIGLLGALFHALNHGLFKSLLFLDAGAILHATGTRDLDRIGGLARYMPLTAATTAIGALAISGVPLLNGFVSKWQIYVSAVLTSRAAPFLAACAVIAIATSALTLASFVKFFGASFLTRQSTLVKERASSGAPLEVPWTMQLPQLFLALACVVLGLVPALALRLVGSAVTGTPQDFGPPGAIVSTGWAGVAAPEGAAVFAPLAVLVVLALLFGVAHLLSRAGGAPRRADAPWLCGYARESDANRYGAHHLYDEVKRWLAPLGGTPRPDPGRRGGAGG